MLIPFDILYEGFCNRVRSSGKSDHIVQIMKKEDNDRVRVSSLLQEEPDLLSLLDRNINDCFESKNEGLSKQLWKRGVLGKSLSLLTEAISYCPVPPLFEEKVLPAFDQQNPKALLQKFIECPMKENPDDLEIMAQMFYDRACILCSRRRFLSALKDFMRAWLLGFSNTLELTYQVAVCCYECGELEIGKELLQCSAQYLRTLSVTNETKSEWTISIVKALKAIEAIRKANSKSKGVSQQKESNLDLTGMTNFNEEIHLFSKLFIGPSDTIDIASKALMLKYSPEKGRHLVAAENIPSGSTIISENPYAWTISKTNYHKFCLWCLQRVDSGIPCSTCASAIFCNPKCREKAMASFHGKECRIMKLLDSSQKLGNMALLCFRTILMTPVSTLLEFTSSEVNLQELAMQIGTATVQKLESSAYSSVFAQTTNSDQRQAGDLLKRTISAIYLTLCLKHIGYLNATPSNSEEKNGHGLMSTSVDLDIAALMLRQLQGASCNAYGINYVENKTTPSDEDEDKEKSLKIEEIGGATFPVISTTNHSCNPNAYRINVPGKGCLVKALRDIKIGEEIFDCYGPLYLTEARTERINKLQAQYLFRCNCLPCTENWPSFGNLRKLPLQYKCSSCQCALRVDDKNMNNTIKCPYCDQVTNMKKLLSSLTVQRERFSLAKSSILAEAFQPFDKDLESIICEYIRMCQTSYIDPCMPSVEAQEVLKLLWNLSIRNLQ